MSNGRRPQDNHFQSRHTGSAEDRLRQARELHQQGKLDEAALVYRNVLEAKPENVDALHFFGILEAQRGRHKEATELIGRAVILKPEDSKAHYNLGSVWRELGQLENALASYDRALSINPNDPSTLNNRGAVLDALKRPKEALASYDRALVLAPTHAGAHTNRGNVLMSLELHDQALLSYGRALSLRPENANAVFGHGKALMKLARYEDALTSFGRTIAIDPAYAEAHAHRGHILFKLGRYVEALASYDKAIAIEPSLVAAHQGRGNALFKLGRGQEACAAYDKAYSIDPDLEYIEGTRLLTKMYVCDWSNLAAERRQLISHVLAGKAAANPFAFLMLGETPHEQLACSRTYAAAQYPPTSPPIWRGEKYLHEKIRVGYVSGEFRDQATAYLVADLFECHDRSAFEIHAISTGIDDGGPMRKRIKAAFDVFSDLSRRSDREIAEHVRRTEIDILINLNGFFGEERTGVVAFKPSPIQVNYLGFPGTMAAPYMDYILADQWIVPEDQKENYSEKVIYLPDSYQANDRKKIVGESSRSRAEFGLPENGFVFCSFNNAYKITPEVFTVWMRLLSQTDGSVLWLLQVDSGVERNLRNEAQERGVSPERIVFAPFIKLKDHLARERLADLFLDTLPVNAHTTASDALWIGLPVLTCLGSTFAGRVASSLLAAVGLEEMITRSLAEYEALALKLAHDPALMAAVRNKLAVNRETYPLFDTPRLARHIEAAYNTIWERQQRGLAPTSFAVSRLER
jgi:predicted O-linked N-acetylglucosamine transferase (SPINDLY family)